MNEVEQLATELQGWYFEGGGLLLSLTSRDAYFGLQETLLRVRETPGFAAEDVLSTDVYEEIREKGSDLRAAIAKDVAARKKPARA